MPKFKYSAIDQNGKQKNGTISAASTEEANTKLNGMGLMPTSVGQVADTPSANGTAAKAKAPKKAGGFGKVIKPDELTVFTRQLATLLQAGLPLLRSLEVMIRQEKNLRFQAVLQQIADQVKSGNSFSDGLAQHPTIFDRLYVNMIRAGEAGGVLDVVLSSLAGFMEKSMKTKKKVKSAMVYPIVVVGVAVSIVVLLMVVVVPKFQSIFDEMLDGAALPQLTQIVIDFSNFVKGLFSLTGILLLDLALVCGILVAGIFLIRVLFRTKQGSQLLNWASINFPKVGDLARKVNIGRITRTFGTLLSSGVPILEAINITRDITGNVYFAKALSNIHNAVRDGESLSAPMTREKVFPNMVTSMVDVGEETGELAEMLNRVADNYDEDVDNAVAGITSIIEPIMIVFLALVVGFIVIALFLPIVEIIKQLSG